MTREKIRQNFPDSIGKTEDSARLSAALVCAPIGGIALGFLNGVADFYTSYAVRNASSGRMDLPFTCAQEICSPSGEHAACRRRLSLRLQN